MGNKTAKPAFDIKSMLNAASVEQATQRQKRLNYKQLIPHEKNHYSLSGIDDLADSIEDVGLQQPLVVKPIGDDQYNIIVGHRRHLAITKLVEERGLEQYADVPCNLADKDEDDTITMLKLHLTNTTARELTEHDKMVAVAEMKVLVEEAKSKGLPVKGKVRDIIADAVNLGPTQVQKYLNINEQATPDVKEALQNGDMTVQEAYDTTRKGKKAPAADGDTDAAGQSPDTTDTDGGPEPDAAKTLKAASSKLTAFKKAAAALEDGHLDSLIEKLEKHFDKLKSEQKG